MADVREFIPEAPDFSIHKEHGFAISVSEEFATATGFAAADHLLRRNYSVYKEHVERDGKTHLHPYTLVTGPRYRLNADYEWNEDFQVFQENKPRWGVPRAWYALSHED